MTHRIVGRLGSRIRNPFPGGAGSVSWRMAATASLAVAAVFAVGRVTMPAFAGVVALYAGYLASRKSVPGQALGTTAYVLAVLWALDLRFGLSVASLVVGYAAKRYAVRTTPTRTFRRPVEGAPGYYYNPATAKPLDRLLMSVESVPVVGPRLRDRLLVALDGVEIVGSELEEDDLFYYLHRDSPGYVFASDDAAGERG